MPDRMPDGMTFAEGLEWLKRKQVEQKKTSETAWICPSCSRQQDVGFDRESFDPTCSHCGKSLDWDEWVECRAVKGNG